MGKGARGLRTVAPGIDVLASSPLVRARETAEIVAKAYGGLEVLTTPALEPEQPPEAVAAWLGKHEGELVALVGHDPALSTLAGWLLSGVAGTERPFVELKKGSAFLIGLTKGGAAPGTGILHWALTPSHLRALAE